jgi:hypothetical protein
MPLRGRNNTSRLPLPRRGGLAESKAQLAKLFAAGAFAPGPTGDVLGPLNDLAMFRNDPSTRTPGNILMAMAALAPLIPSMTQMKGLKGAFDDDYLLEKLKKSTRIRDKEGNPVRLLQGRRGGRTKPSMSRGTNAWYGEGSYWTEPSKVADGYAGTKTGANVASAYLDIKRPLIIDQQSDYVPDVLRKIVDRDGILRDGVTDKMVREATDRMKKMGYDGVVVLGGLDPKTGRQVFEEVVAFSPDQILSRFK